MKKKLKMYDRVFYNFERHTINGMKGDRITSVSIGRTSISGFNLCCYPDEPIIESISNRVRKLNDEFSYLQDSNINYRDFNRELVNRWCEMCENKDNSKELERLYESLS